MRWWPVANAGGNWLERRYLLRTLGDKTASCPKVEGGAEIGSFFPVCGQHPCAKGCFEELFPMMVVHPSFTGVNCYLYPWGHQ